MRAHILALSLLSVIATALVACGGGSATPTPEASILSTWPVAGPVLRSDPAFKVVFRWNESPAIEGVAVWQQAGNAFRLDFARKLASESGEFTEGAIPDIHAGGRCVWYKGINDEVTADGELRADCGSGPELGGSVGAVRDVFGATLTGPLPQRTIAGRDADCYTYEYRVPSVDDRFPPETEYVCVDRTARIPLYVAASMLGGGFIQLEATVVASPPPDFLLWETDPRFAGLGHGRFVLRIAELRLPQELGVTR